MIARVVPFESFRAEIGAAVLTPVSEKKSSKPSLRRSLGAKQHYAAVPAALRARTQSKGESLG
jgi:hypothetical protein